MERVSFIEIEVFGYKSQVDIFLRSPQLDPLEIRYELKWSFNIGDHLLEDSIVWMADTSHYSDYAKWMREMDEAIGEIVIAKAKGSIKKIWFSNYILDEDIYFHLEEKIKDHPETKDLILHLFEDHEQNKKKKTKQSN